MTNRLRDMMTVLLVALTYILLSQYSTVRADESASGWPAFGGPNGNFALTADANKAIESSPRVLWRATCGDGMSSIATKDNRVYVSYLSPADSTNKKSDKTPHNEVVAALRKSDGSVDWEYKWDAGWLEDQEAFGGRSRAPQSTPLIHGDQIFVIGFTGWLHCLERKTGKLCWKRNLVADFKAVPVQFGFSASPVISLGQLIILAGGPQGGLVSIAPKTGKTLWHVPCKEASYATPIELQLDGETQLVFETREAVLGVDAATGKERWRYDLPEAGLTNVPTPLSLGRGRIAISGQGVGGTRELILSKDSGEWSVEEGWKSDTQFFYCNWIHSQNHIFGCNGNLLVTLDATNGERVARWRGFRDANILRLGDSYLILDRAGTLTLAAEQPTGLRVKSRFQIIDGRCWTPPTLDGHVLYCRGGRDLACVSFEKPATTPAKASSSEELRPLPIRKKVHLYANATDDEKQNSSAASDEPEQPPIEQIVATFEKSGPDAAWKTYESIRKKLGKRLSFEERKKLTLMAFEQGLNEFGDSILQHSLADFAKNPHVAKIVGQLRKKYTRQPSSKTTKGKNGLTYLEIGIRNVRTKKLDTVVRGPKQHPFSYGIPFPSGKLRIEKWPVGTKLFESDNEEAGKLLFTVEEKNAGKVIDIR